MILATLALLAILGPVRACPISAATILPELTGTWKVLSISGLDRARPDSATARSTFVPELQNCLIREQLRADTGIPPYEALILWGVNGADGSIQRVFTTRSMAGSACTKDVARAVRSRFASSLLGAAVQRCRREPAAHQRHRPFRAGEPDLE